MSLTGLVNSVEGKIVGLREFAVANERMREINRVEAEIGLLEIFTLGSRLARLDKRLRGDEDYCKGYKQ